ncbi:MAG TPA: hypothetical protein PKE06_25545 [Flavilitoribacter sp.]|nr:hypothetical protein [Flavilitoribacter sp.]HMQ91287.1 hypothetical protein [Flavilitoribacter sp.]
MFLLSVLFLLRLAQRQLLSLLFQDPPRTTRRAVQLHPMGVKIAKNPVFKTPALSKTYMAKPGIEPVFQALRGEPVLRFKFQQFAEKSFVPPQLGFQNGTVGWKYTKPQERNPIFRLKNLGLFGMKFKAKAVEIFFYLPFPIMQFFLIILKQDKIVNITDISGRLQNFFDKMIQSIQIHVAPELTGEVPDRQALSPFNRRKQVVAWKPL